MLGDRMPGRSCLAADPELRAPDPGHGRRGGEPGKPNFDSRRDEVAKVSGALARRTGVLARDARAAVDDDRTSGGVRSRRAHRRPPDPPERGDAATSRWATSATHTDALRPRRRGSRALSLAARYTSPNGVTHLTWQQTSRGVDAYDNLLTANVAKDGRMVNARARSSTTSTSRRPPPGRRPPRRSPPRSATSACRSPRPRQQPGRHRPPHEVRQRRHARASSPSPTRTATASPGALTVAGEDPFVYDVVVDAASGERPRPPLADRVRRATRASTTTTRAPPDGDAAHRRPRRRPDWLTARATTALTGPNAHAYADVGAPTASTPARTSAPSGGTDWVYPQTGRRAPARR